ncbi:MAG: beta-glucosidase, partial [Bacteroidetes bacterium]|nr:beta-glucosidase [Bacteroidota bacterium]
MTTRLDRFIATKLICLLLLWGVVSGRAQDAAIERSVDSLLSMMTLEEKCGQLNQIPANWKDGVSYLTDEAKEMVRRGQVGSLLNAAGASSIREIQRLAAEDSRLGIPLIIGVDIIHGSRTIFPVPLAEASSWDPELVQNSARVAAAEASAAGIHWTFAPMVDIARDPRWGRIVEGSGEDPYLGSVMAAARVRGFQGTNLADPTSILACAK